MKWKCDKCGVASDRCVRVAPIDKDGRTLSNAHLCPNCRAKWSEIFKKKIINVSSNHFKSTWSSCWEQFMHDRYIEPEVVQFT